MFEQLGEREKEGVLGVKNPEAPRSTDATADSGGVKSVDRRGSLDPNAIRR